MLDHKNHLGPVVHQISNAFEKAANYLLKKFDITSSQADVLLFLIHCTDESVCQKRIEDHLNISNPTMTGILKRMEKKNLIESCIDDNDRRFKNIALTKKALKINVKMEKHIMELENKLTKGLSASEVKMLRQLLTKVHNNITI